MDFQSIVVEYKQVAPPGLIDFWVKTKVAERDQRPQ